jgi:hypothetical protein
VSKAVEKDTDGKKKRLHGAVFRSKTGKYQ